MTYIPIENTEEWQAFERAMAALIHASNKIEERLPPPVVLSPDLIPYEGTA